MRSLPLLLALLWPVAWAGAQTENGPVVRIRARSELRLAEGRRQPLGPDTLALGVQIVLRDAPSQKPLADQAVDVLVLIDAPDAPAGPAGERRRLRTDAQGRALLPLTLPIGSTGSYRVRASYPGDALRDPAAAELAIDLRKDPVRLLVSAPETVPLRGTLRLAAEVRAESGIPPGPLRVELDRREFPLPLRQGRGELELPLAELPGAGVVRGGETLLLRVRYPGNLLFAAAAEERRVLVTTQARVTLALEPPLPAGEVAQRGRLSFAGLVSDEEGPLAHTPVDIIAEPAEGAAAALLLPAGATDERGRFRIVVEKLRLAPGPFSVWARALPGRSHRLPGRSPPLPIYVLPPEPVSVLYYLAPLLATLLGGALVFVWRRRPPLLTALRRMFLGAAGAAGEEGAAPGQPGVRLSQKPRAPALLSRRGTDHDDTIEGQVEDASFRVPLPGAAVRARPAPAPRPGPEFATLTDGQGRFRLAGLPAGSYQVEVSAPGYLDEGFPGTLPHRGELRGVKVALLSIRVRILDLWRQLAPPLLAAGEDLRPITARELYGKISDRHGAPVLGPLGRLTDLLEDAYYSARLCTPALLDEAQELFGHVRAELPPEPPAPPPRRSRVVPL